MADAHNPSEGVGSDLGSGTVASNAPLFLYEAIWTAADTLFPQEVAAFGEDLPRDVRWGSDRHRDVFRRAGSIIRDLLFAGKLIATWPNQLRVVSADWEAYDPEDWFDRQSREPAFRSMRVRRDRLLQALSGLELLVPYAPLSAGPSKRRGRPAAFDWDEYERAYTARVKVDGKPGSLNDDGWQRQADVARFLQSLAKQDGKTMEWTTAKRRAGRLMQHDGA